jgi:hypothetical protein
LGLSFGLSAVLTAPLSPLDSLGWLSLLFPQPIFNKSGFFLNYAFFDNSSNIHLKKLSQVSGAFNREAVITAKFFVTIFDRC